MDSIDFSLSEMLHNTGLWFFDVQVAESIIANQPRFLDPARACRSGSLVSPSAAAAAQYAAMHTIHTQMVAYDIVARLDQSYPIMSQ